MKGRFILFLILFNLLLFGFIVYKLNYNHRENLQKYISSVQLQNQIRAIECASESKIYNLRFFIGKDTSNPVAFTGEFPVLICNFSVQSCSPCYEMMLDIVADIFPDYKERKDIIFLSNDLEFRYRDSFHGKKIYSNTTTERLAIEKWGVPYFFILDSDSKTDLVMYCDKANPGLIKDHLTIIKERLTNKN